MATALHDGMAKPRWSWETVPVRGEPYWVSSALDGPPAALLWDCCAPTLAEHRASYDMEMATQWVMARAEERGMRVDLEYARGYSAELTERADTRRERLRYYLQRDRNALNCALRIFLDQIGRHRRAHSPGAGADARAGAVAFIQRFGSSRNPHTHFHVCVSDGVFEPDPRERVRCFATQQLDAGDTESVQTRVRHRILRAFARRAILDKADCKEMKPWAHGGGFSRDATVRIAANDRQGLERLLRYWARAPFAAERLAELDRHRLIYQRAKPGPDGRTQLILLTLGAYRAHRGAGTTAVPTPPPLLRRAGPHRARACCRHHPGHGWRSHTALGTGAEG